ncbi:MAG: SDR family NAD(P)-dependent oxidoreductase [Chloroflexota bacterium]|jgi:short-subunit dehydrogenase
MKQINNAVYIISGASAGIGAALAHELAGHGARLVLIARRADVLATIRQQLTNAPVHQLVIGDIGERDTMERAVETAMTSFGQIDGVICNAGIGLSAPVAQIEIADFQSSINTNVYGVLHMIQVSLPVFMQQQHGHLIVVSSVVGVQGLPYSGGYCATKGAIERLCDALRIELLDTGVALTVVRPGTVTTEFVQRRRGLNREVRATGHTGIPAAIAARRIVDGIRRQNRYIYTRWQDRLLLWGSQLVAPLADRVLARSIRWRE